MGSRLACATAAAVTRLVAPGPIEDVAIRVPAEAGQSLVDLAQSDAQGEFELSAADPRLADVSKLWASHDRYLRDALDWSALSAGDTQQSVEGGFTIWTLEAKPLLRVHTRDSAGLPAVGQGHDYSLGVLWEGGGDDHYVAPGLGLGGGNDNGIGYLLDAGGDDVYDAPDGRTFGGAGIGGDENNPRLERLCLGIFVDADGEDTYTRFSEDGEEAPAIGNDRSWALTDRRENTNVRELGGGLDASAGEIGLGL